MTLTIETEQEDDGRWLAEIPELAGAMAYGDSQIAAVAQAKALALRIVADRLDHSKTTHLCEAVRHGGSTVGEEGVKAGDL